MLSNVISSHLRIYRFYQFATIRYTIDFKDMGVSMNWKAGKVLLRKRMKCFANITAEKFENTTFAGRSGFLFEEDLVGEITWLSWRHRFWEATFTKCVLSTRKRKAGDCKLLRLEQRFRKIHLRFGLLWMPGRPNRKNKSPFLNISGWVWTGPE